MVTSAASIVLLFLPLALQPSKGNGREVLFRQQLEHFSGFEPGLPTRLIFISSLNSSSSSDCFTSLSLSSTFSFFRVQVRVLRKFVKFFQVQKIK